MILSEIGNKVRVLRKEKGMSQETLAKMVGLSRNTLSKLENGYIANISIVALDRVLNKLGYELEIKSRNPFIS
ncbi:MAG: helix-turn-helix transcriptional regulator [Sulfurimonas sp.]|nr:helix-turn-helix transcriptional regulator [Sulfurimonas sp.]